ncbi:MAG: bifunctional (p)ppGpp synthetase/guanosine-3',5'-bis(diphosphate) 3'-pyrophosphohydrolase [Clostridia bacterium]|nr:bifunctional (p)ppGpp synthetase/guanosine-3',5'-bis(diphosphate) 3'-pyrophosphohydrolase [Clostridia bacterium]
MADPKVIYLSPEELSAKSEKSVPGSGELIRKAYEFAAKAHADQKRKSGEPYIEHPRCVASIVSELMIDPPSIAAAFLHDTLEDCEDVTLELLEKEFGEEVARMVDGVTKLGRLNFADREEQQAESLRKMIFAMSRDIRVILIKLADRLHNMRTLEFQPQDRQVAISRETLDIYAPLAHRLGVYAVKQELEDLSLSYIDPEGYELVKRKVGMERADREANIKLIISQLKSKLDEEGIRYEIDGRPKHLYSIYRKMVIQNKTFDQIYDLIAIRVIVDTIPDCYRVLGIVHTLWIQVPGRFKDYISVPKANMYRSLHTTVMGGRQIPFPFEIQIRTWEMHQVAEYGIAAHWRYKEGGGNDSLDKKLYWLRQIMDWQSETRDSREFIDGLKTDLFSEEVFIFTPKGDIINMQRGATPLDFAYRIHSHVGNSCVGAKVNGKMVPLDTELETGDRVDILTSSSSRGPSMDWINVVKTQQAKAKIRQFFKKELRGENVQKGKESLEREARRRNVKLSDYMKSEFYEPIMRKYQFQELDDLYGAVGYGGVASQYVLQRLMDEKKRQDEKNAPRPLPPPVEQAEEPRHMGTPTHGVYVEGDPGMLVRFARCCNPVPGDEIVGYITRGRGVTVHKADCVNALHSEPERAINVAWADDKSESFNVNLQVICYDHPALLAELGTLFEEMKIQLTAMSVRINKNSTVTITSTLRVTSREQLDAAINKLRRRSDVIEAYRGKA